MPFIQFQHLFIGTTQAQPGCKLRDSERLMSWWSSCSPAEYPACILQDASKPCRFDQGLDRLVQAFCKGKALLPLECFSITVGMTFLCHRLSRSGLGESSTLQSQAQAARAFCAEKVRACSPEATQITIKILIKETVKLLEFRGRAETWSELLSSIGLTLQRGDSLGRSCKYSANGLSEQRDEVQYQ